MRVAEGTEAGGGFNLRGMRTRGEEGSPVSLDEAGGRQT